MQQSRHALSEQGVCIRYAVSEDNVSCSTLHAFRPGDGTVLGYSFHLLCTRSSPITLSEVWTMAKGTLPL